MSDANVRGKMPRRWAETESLQVLLIEDNPGDARLFEELLRESEQKTNIRWKEDLTSGLHLLSKSIRGSGDESESGEATIDVLVVDLGLPDSDGTRSVEQVVKVAPELPVVVLTGQQGMETALSALEQGASEYLRKDELTPSLLARTLRWAIERKEMERERKRSNRQRRVLSEAIEQADEAVLITEGAPLEKPGPRIWYANEAFEEMTGYSKEELLGNTPRLLQGPKTSRKVLNRVREALEEEQSVEAEAVNYRKSGEPYVASWVITPVFDDEGMLTHWVSVQEDVTDQWVRKRRLEHRATHDSLTGLPNRAALQKEVKKVVDSGSEESSSKSLRGALLYLDVNRVKLVNDRLGYEKGDQLLIRMGEIMQETVEERGIAARIGGDEFAICLPEAESRGDVRQVTSRLFEALEAPIDVGEDEVYADVNVGAVVDLSKYETAGEALHDADTAMYVAKSEGEQIFVK